jgi:hypothetical protein
LKAVERFRIPAGVPGRMCPAAVRAWEELSHAVYRASTLLRSPPTRPCNVCPSGVAQQPLAAAVVVIPLKIRPSACSRNEMRLAFSEASTGNPARSASNPARSAILAAVQRAWLASALAGADALCSSADVERANAPSPSRSQSLSSRRFECENASRATN